MYHSVLLEQWLVREVIHMKSQAILLEAGLNIWKIVSYFCTAQSLRKIDKPGKDILIMYHACKWFLIIYYAEDW